MNGTAATRPPALRSDRIRSIVNVTTISVSAIRMPTSGPPSLT